VASPRRNPGFWDDVKGVLRERGQSCRGAYPRAKARGSNYAPTKARRSDGKQALYGRPGLYGPVTLRAPGF
jgi:hypothetical protein